MTPPRVAASLAFLLAAPPAIAQAPSPEAPAGAAQRVLGEVVALDAAGVLTVKTDAGATVTVRTGGETRFLRARPGATTLEGAAAVGFADIAAGDRVLARGSAAAGAGALDARQVVVMTRGDIADKQERERAEWRRRGIQGVVTALAFPPNDGIKVRAALPR